MSNSQLTEKDCLPETWLDTSHGRCKACRNVKTAATLLYPLGKSRIQTVFYTKLSSVSASTKFVSYTASSQMHRLTSISRPPYLCSNQLANLSTDCWLVMSSSWNSALMPSALSFPRASSPFLTVKRRCKLMVCAGQESQSQSFWHPCLYYNSHLEGLSSFPIV